MPVSLQPGGPVTVIKLHPDGSSLVRYPGTVLFTELDGDWLAVEAHWTNKHVNAHGLDFLTGDNLVEIFSPTMWFNVFHVFASDGTHRGWYANVTRPTLIESTDREITVTWPDLYLDLIASGEQPPLVCDEDELAESGLERQDPLLYDKIVTTMHEMTAMAQGKKFPFIWPLG
jgi:predicted RNA-binding protein associated with RNAse of E/G family